MKRAFLVLALALLGAFAFAQEKIAVFPFEDMDNLLTKNESVFFYRQFSNEFTNKNAGRFTIVPRQDVEKLFNAEEKFQLSDLSAKVKTAETQRVLNGTQILSGVIGKVGNRITISVSLYTFPELSQLPGGVDLRVANKDELFDKIPELVRSMQDRIGGDGGRPTPPGKTYKIGDTGPAGGIIFFARDGKYMECSGELGKHNWNTAVTLAENYDGGGFQDWRLPTKDELNLMYVNLKARGLGGFKDEWYWSSSQYVYYNFNYYAWHQNFTNGSQYHDKDTSNYNVRAVRAF